MALGESSVKSRCKDARCLCRTESRKPPPGQTQLSGWNPVMVLSNKRGKETGRTPLSFETASTASMVRVRLRDALIVHGYGLDGILSIISHIVEDLNSKPATRVFEEAAGV